MDIMFVFLIVGLVSIGVCEWRDRGRSDLLKRGGSRSAFYKSLIIIFVLAAFVEFVSIPVELKSGLKQGEANEIIVRELYWNVGTFAGFLLLINLCAYLLFKRKTYFG